MPSQDSRHPESRADLVPLADVAEAVAAGTDLGVKPGAFVWVNYLGYGWEKGQVKKWNTTGQHAGLWDVRQGLTAPPCCDIDCAATVL